MTQFAVNDTVTYRSDANVLAREVIGRKFTVIKVQQINSRRQSILISDGNKTLHTSNYALDRDEDKIRDFQAAVHGLDNIPLGTDFVSHLI